MKPKQPHGPPMTLGNMRNSASAGKCHEHTTL
jgi:hypothetical protein